MYGSHSIVFLWTTWFWVRFRFWALNFFLVFGLGFRFGVLWLWAWACIGIGSGFGFPFGLSTQCQALSSCFNGSGLLLIGVVIYRSVRNSFMAMWWRFDRIWIGLLRFLGLVPGFRFWFLGHYLHSTSVKSALSMCCPKSSLHRITLKVHTLPTWSTL